MPSEPPLPRAFVSHHLLGVVVLNLEVPGRREGGWSFGADSAGRAQEPHTSSRGSCRFYWDRRCTWSPRRCCSLPALDCGRGRQGRIGVGECGRGGGGERGPASFRGLLPQSGPPAAASVLFPLVPGAVTPISVRGDLRESGGEGRGSLCGERRGGGRGALGSGVPVGPGLFLSPLAAPFPAVPSSTARRGPQAPRSGWGP